MNVGIKSMDKSRCSKKDDCHREKPSPKNCVGVYLVPMLHRREILEILPFSEVPLKYFVMDLAAEKASKT